MTHLREQSRVSDSHVAENGNGAIALPISESGGLFRPFQIVSLKKMLERYGQGFYRMGEVMQSLFAQGALGTLIKSESGKTPLPDDVILRVGRELDNLRAWCVLLKLEMSIKGIDWAKASVQETSTFQKLNTIIPEVQRRVFDELDSAWFIDIPTDRVSCYENAQMFGEAVLNKIPNIDTDVAEAGSCFATGRYTACVFHLMRIMERGTQELGNKLGIQLTEEKNWQNILDQVNKRVRGMQPQTPRDKEHRDNFSAATAHLHNVKEAWRNRVMHPKQTYTDEEAKAVMDSVKAFVIHLAERVL